MLEIQTHKSKLGETYLKTGTGYAWDGHKIRTLLCASANTSLRLSSSVSFGAKAATGSEKFEFF